MAFYNNAGKKECRRNHMFPFLVLLALASTILGICCITPLESEERISIRRGLYLFGLGLVFFTSLFNLVNHVALKTHTGLKFKKKYHLSVTDIFDISNKFVSSIQALLSCLTGLIVCTYSCTRSFLHTSHFVSEAYAWFGAAYFFYDVWSMYRVHSASIGAPQGTGPQNGASKGKVKSPLRRFGEYLKSHPVIVMHHLFIGSFGFLVIVYLRGGLGDCVFGYVYMMELSTPFVSLRGVLSRLGLKTSKLYVFNGLAMLGTFFFCRVAMFPYVCYLYAQVVGLPYLDAVMSLPRGCKIGILVLLLPQFYWFWLMLKGATQVFCSPKSVVPTAVVSRKQRRGTNHTNHNHNS